MNRIGYLQAVLAAGLFGTSAPLAKLLVGEIDPVALAGLLYLGSGIGLLMVQGGRRLLAGVQRFEAPLHRADLPWLAGAVLVGGAAAPILLMFSLQVTPAATASLLLNFESAATTLIAWAFFRERLGRAVFLPLLLVTGASILLSYDPQAVRGFSPGALGVLGACILWGLDNNFTGQISAKDPQVIVTIKGLAAGTFSLVLALLLGRPLPGWITAAPALLLGLFSYGLSIVLFVLAMRSLGAARTSALFGAAPLAGVIVAAVVLQETMPGFFWIALALTIGGIILLGREQHVHLHEHDPLIHDHRHRHDDLHHHHHPPLESPLAHAHLHEHEQTVHEHDHRPDPHHRHE